MHLYAERGLAHQRVSVWLYEGRLHIEYQQTMLESTKKSGVPPEDRAAQLLRKLSGSVRFRDRR